MSARYLAWDTSRNTGVLCAFEVSADASSLAIRHEALLTIDQRQHSEGLFVGIDDALRACGWSWSDLSGIGVGIGPGSFTGVRVGLTAARTFGQVLGLPLFGVSSLEVVATWARERGVNSSLLVVSEACMGEVYCRLEPQANAQSTSEKVVKLVDLAGWLEGGLDQTAAVICSARLSQSPVILKALEKNAQLRWVDDQALADLGESPNSRESYHSWPQSWPVALAQSVFERIKLGQGTLALELAPTYLREPDAVLKLRLKSQSAG
jgi:tRNA threonylcarbamoyl adenosine modification protein YeaZ